MEAIELAFDAGDGYAFTGALADEGGFGLGEDGEDVRERFACVVGGPRSCRRVGARRAPNARGGRAWAQSARRPS